MILDHDWMTQPRTHDLRALDNMNLDETYQNANNFQKPFQNENVHTEEGGKFFLKLHSKKLPRDNS